VTSLTGRIIRVRSRRFEAETPEGVRTVVIPKALRFRDPEFVDPVAVGDTVVLEQRGDETVVTSVDGRKNALSRPASGRRGKRQILAANVDLAVIVLSTLSPRWKPSTLDRYLVLASSGGISPAVCLNKIDLSPEDRQSPLADVYRDLGIPVLFTSVITGEGMEDLKARLAGKTCILFGPSGVGKSSLINVLNPDADLRVGEISDRTDKGMHTTTWVEMIRLVGGGRLIDSPGIRVLDLTGVSPENLTEHFPEMTRDLRRCRFSDCWHRTEPGCEVKAALERGEIAPSRYDSYCRIMDSLESGHG